MERTLPYISRTRAAKLARKARVKQIKRWHFLKKKMKPAKEPNTEYVSLWLLMDGAIKNCMMQHPEYFNSKAQQFNIRMSLVKRATGAAMNFFERRRATPARPES